MPSGNTNFMTYSITFMDVSPHIQGPYNTLAVPESGDRKTRLNEKIEDGIY